MTNLTPARLAELRAVAEEAEPMIVFGGPAQNTYVSVEKQELLALIAALEAKTAELDAKADYVSDLEERVRQRDNHVIPVLHARIKEAERERDEARAEVEGLADDGGHKAAKYWKWWQREKARADRAEASVRYATSRMIDARSILQQMADRIDPFVFDELASELDDQPMDANGDTFEHRLVRAEAALERVRAARAGHPECDKYDDDSPVKCGWKRTVQSIDAALKAIEGADDD